MTLPNNPTRRSSRGRTATGEPNPIDIHVGGRVRLRRTLLGMSQEKLASAIGVTFQQIQKYERGANRIGASRLFDFAQALDVPPSFFFDGMDGDVAAHSPARIDASTTAAPTISIDPLAKRETLELVRAYYRITDPAQRKRIFELVKTMAKPDDTPPPATALRLYPAVAAE